MIPYIKDLKKFKEVAKKFDFEEHLGGYIKKKYDLLIHITSKGNIYCYRVDNGNFIKVERFKMQIKDIKEFIGWRSFWSK